MITILIAALLGLCVSAIAVVKGKKRRGGGGGGDASTGLSQGIGSDHDHWCCSSVQEMSLHGGPPAAGDETAEELLARVQGMAAAVLAAATAAGAFPGRWKAIAAKLERLPACLSDLSSHPCFAKNALCRELLQSVAATLAEAAELAGRCREPPRAGKLQMQSAIDALAGNLDLNLRDCALLVKTGVLSDASGSSPPAEATAGTTPSEAQADVRELLARLQIGHSEAKNRAVDGLLEALHKDERSVLSVLGRANVSAMVQLLTASAPKVREKAATVICQLAESGSCEGLLVSEGVLPPLIRLAESGSLVGREKAAITLQRLSMSPDIARAIVGHGGVGPLIEICRTGDSISQSAAAGALKNLSAVPEVRQALADEGTVRVMVSLLDCGAEVGSKDYAAECLQNLTSSNDSLRRAVVSEGGLRSLLLYLDGPLPQESAVSALRNLVGSVSPDSLVSLGVLPRLVHVLRVGSIGAQQAAAAAICRISSSADMKRVVGEHGCMPLLVHMLEAKSNGAREVAAQAVARLVSYPPNAREMKKDEKSVPSLVQLLDPSPVNTAKKYAISCLLSLSAIKRCKKLMISHGAIGYLKKLSDMDVAGAKKLLERLERGRLRSLFSSK
ncbi:vacuolar protein 8-like isoform X2 [Phragmites australis]|uniref:vacuolar protein 8-like isoform X2 n=1 Tax=Phragmites australis TaxID=29695 RepID=UPI002D778D46|nr:vacuolar protein 8-like isoform X2 [Phragmites australis]